MSKKYSTEKQVSQNEVEIWKDIKGYEGYYQVSNHGRVKSVTRTIIASDNKPYCFKGKLIKLQGNRYQSIVVSKKSNLKNLDVHRLVLEAFVGPCPDGMECCHSDGNGQNNNVNNLRWDTREGNIADKKKHGTTGLGKPKLSIRGELHYCSKLTENDVRIIREMHSRGLHVLDIWKHFTKVTLAAINHVVKGHSWTHVK
jgi:hypothetical protein